MNEMKEAWHVFQIRRALLSTPSLGYVFGIPNMEMRLPQLWNAAASILYINAVSLLDEACCMRLTDQELERHRTLNRRLQLLSDRGDLIDYGALDRIRERRNELAHQKERDATVEELSGACEIIQRQLVAWGLAEDRPPYTFHWERSGMRDTPSDADHWGEQDRIVRVMHGDEWVFEAKQTVKFARVGK